MMDAANELEREQERRRRARIVNTFLVRFSLAEPLHEEEADKTTAIIHDINSAGVSFLTNQPCRQGDLIYLEIEVAGCKRSGGETGLLNAATINSAGSVVRIVEIDPGLHLVAAAFKEISPEDLEILLQAISFC